MIFLVFALQYEYVGIHQRCITFCRGHLAVFSYQRGLSQTEKISSQTWYQMGLVRYDFGFFYNYSDYSRTQRFPLVALAKLTNMLTFAVIGLV